MKHGFIPNSARAIGDSFSRRADMVHIEVQLTKDNQLVVFGDPLLECHTNGKGRVRDHTLAELAKLNTGHTYSFDDGKTFPLRQFGQGAMLSFNEAIRYFGHAKLVVEFLDADPQIAALAVAAFTKAERPITERHSFFGPEAVMALLKPQTPKSWAWSNESAAACASSYARIGWAGFVPEACKNGTIIINLDEQWKTWGWPNRFAARMATAGTRIVLKGRTNAEDPMAGIASMDDIGNVPHDYKGYLWVDNISDVGDAIRG